MGRSTPTPSCTSHSQHAALAIDGAVATTSNAPRTHFTQVLPQMGRSTHALSCTSHSLTSRSTCQDQRGGHRHHRHNHHHHHQKVT
eukprot:scaffold252481_cov20-Tisochrysis_lutea.AAC.1